MERDAAEILEALEEEGKMPTAAEVIALCRLAIVSNQRQEWIDAFVAAAPQCGLQINNVTTDDDAGTVLELVRIEQE